LYVFITFRHSRKTDGIAVLSIHLLSTHWVRDTHQEQRMVSYEFTG
jgi:hypothetical protein